MHTCGPQPHWRPDEENVHTRLARADRLLLDPADLADPAVEEDLARRRHLVAVVDVLPELLQDVEREREPCGGPADAVGVDRDLEGSRSVWFASRITPTIPRLEPSPAATVASGTTSERWLRLIVKRKVVPTGLPAITRATSPGVRIVRPLIATMMSVWWRWFAAGKPGRTAATSAPFCTVVTFFPSERSATAAATCWDVRISDALT